MLDVLFAELGAAVGLFLCFKWLAWSDRRKAKLAAIESAKSRERLREQQAELTAKGGNEYFNPSLWKWRS